MQSKMKMQTESTEQSKPSLQRNIMIVGVGGQGTLLTSRILANLAIGLDFDVKVSEVHGMAQRGGSVVTFVRIGDEIYEPIVEVGQTDILLAFEELEARRYLHYLKPGGTLVVNLQRILPMPVTIGAMAYPEGMIPEMQQACKTVAVNATQLARDVGNLRTFNVVLLGQLARHLDLPYEAWINAVEKSVPPKTKEVNLRAFVCGYNLEEA